jgi:PAS domain S-box-containing protein
LHGWIHIVSDLAIFAAYVAIPCVLLYFIGRRRDVPFSRIFLLFGAFILSCGAGHLIEAGIFFWPVYRVSAMMKVTTAIVSWATVVALIRVTPAALSLPGLKKTCEDLEREVEARKRVEAILRSSESRFRSVTEAAPSGFILVDGRGRIAQVNLAAARMFAYPQSELVGASIEALVPDSVRARHPELRARFQEHPEARAMGAGRDLRGRRKDGSEIPVEVGLNPMDVDGEMHILCSVVDITERKNTEEALAEYAEELARSNADLEDFAYIASHDLKEPLRGIRNYISFLIEDHAETLDSDAQTKLDTLDRLAIRMQSQIESLLKCSLVGQTNLAIAETDLDRVLEEVLDSLRIMLAEKGVEVRRTAVLPVVHCDGVRVAEVFHNLITNAVKYNDKPRQWVEVGVAGVGSETAIYVRDNGIGIPERHRDRVFVIFKRLHGRDEYGGGTGAGLTIARKVVERHGGKIWLESELGEGTTFLFTLPPLEMSVTSSKGAA